MKNMNGSYVSDILYSELNKYLKNKRIPSIVDISIGDDFGSLMYSKMKEKTINNKTAIKFKSIHFDNISKDELINYIINLNNDTSVDGIMIQLPLPDYLSVYKREILDSISKEKDIDGLTSYSIKCMESGNYNFIPCTALGIETLLKCYSVRLLGKRVAIINRSDIVGKPLSYLMNRNFALPVVCHSKTENLSSITKECNVVVAALNKKELITREYIKDGATVIDVGVHKSDDGNTVGDVNYNDVYDKVSLITPSVGGVGPMTICMLAYNVSKVLYGDEVFDILENGIEKVKEWI